MIVALVAAATVVRIAVLFASRLELYPDEAQYWVWSRHLAFGYFSKPPMIAWLIRATTTLGDGEAFVRLSAPLLHGATALVLSRAARRLYDAETGLWTALLYMLIPGVQLSSAIMATDAPLLFCVSAGGYAYAVFVTAPSDTTRRRAALALGAAVGVGVLNKYAALYLAGGVALHALASRSARARWTPASVLAAVAAAAVLMAPNLIWNLQHHFQTVTHTAENADLGGAERGLKGLLGARGPVGFVLGQFGVFGPIPFAVVAIGAWRARRPDTPEADRLLLWLAAPAFAIVFGESIVARANANWAGAGYAPAVVLAAALLVRWRARRWRQATVALQLVIALGFVAGVVAPGLADRVGAGGAFKRARGWAATAAAVATTAREAAARKAEAGQPLTAVAVDDRFLFNALAYYARGRDQTPAGALAAPLRMWVHLARPANQAEAESPLDEASGAHVFAVSANADYLPAFRADFAAVAPIGRVRVPLDRLNDRRSHERSFELFIGDGFAPRPRDPVTGRPVVSASPTGR